MRSFPFVLMLSLLICSCGNNSQDTAPSQQKSTAPLTGEFEFETKTISGSRDASEAIGKFPAEVKIPGQQAYISKVSGTVEYIHVSEGQRFSKGDLLFQIDNSSSFSTYSQAKKEFTDLLENRENNFPEADKKIIMKFRSTISPSDLLPAFPAGISADSQKDPLFREMLEKYNALIQLEQHIKDHFVIASEDGVAARVLQKKGSVVKTAEKIIVTGKSPSKYVVVSQEVSQEQTIELRDEKGKLLEKHKGSELKNRRLNVNGKLRSGKDYFILIR